jgi:hypothetical protein
MAGFGFMGGCLMFFGDMCFYMVPISGTDFMRTSVMTSMPTTRLILGGSVGPLAGLLYGLGSLVFYLGLRDHNKLLARIITTLFVVMFVVGGAYHSIFATYGFVADPDLAGTTVKITALIGSLQKVSLITGIFGSVLFVYMVLRYPTVFPKWTVLITPTFWTLLNMPMVPFVPYPLGSIVVGGWINLCFMVFFAICFFVIGKDQHLQN